MTKDHKIEICYATNRLFHCSVSCFMLLIRYNKVKRKQKNCSTNGKFNYVYYLQKKNNDVS